MRDILCGFSGGVARKATWQSVWKSQERYANGFDESTECVCVWATEQRATRWLAGFDEKMNGKNMLSVGKAFQAACYVRIDMQAYTAQSRHTGSNTRRRAAKRGEEKNQYANLFI